MKHKFYAHYTLSRNNKKILGIFGNVWIFYYSFFIGSVYLQYTKKWTPDQCALHYVSILKTTELPIIFMCDNPSFALKWLADFCLDYWSINQYCSWFFIAKPLKEHKFKFSFSTVCIYFCIIGLSSYGTDECLPSLFFKMVNNVEINSYYLLISLFDES
jgi:hypothetical protein